MSLPLPVPSESFDFTPPDLWPALWEAYPLGVEMPGSVPKKIWEDHWRRANPSLAKSVAPPPAPAFLKSYWGKLRGRALSSRKRKAGEEEPLPPVWPSQLSKAFWARYFELFPNGHAAPAQEPYCQSSYGQEDPKRYSLFRGALHVNAGSQERPLWRPSTGVDAWDKHGNWLGPG